MLHFPAEMWIHSTCLGRGRPSKVEEAADEALILVHAAVAQSGSFLLCRVLNAAWDGFLLDRVLASEPSVGPSHSSQEQMSSLSFNQLDSLVLFRRTLTAIPHVPLELRESISTFEGRFPLSCESLTLAGWWNQPSAAPRHGTSSIPVSSHGYSRTVSM